MNDELVLERFVVTVTDMWSLVRGKFHYVPKEANETLCGKKIPPEPSEKPLIEADCHGKGTHIEHKKVCKYCQRKVESFKGKVRLAKKKEGRKVVIHDASDCAY